MRIAELITQLAKTISSLIEAANGTAANATATAALLASKDDIIDHLKQQETADQQEISEANAALADLMAKAQAAISSPPTEPTVTPPTTATDIPAVTSEPVATAPSIIG